MGIIDGFCFFCGQAREESAALKLDRTERERAELQTERDELRREIERARMELNGSKHDLQRAQEDLQRVEERTERELSSYRRDADEVDPILFFPMRTLRVLFQNMVSCSAFSVAPCRLFGDAMLHPPSCPPCS